jgi:acyl carrier protein
MTAEELVAFAARVLKVEPAALSLDTAYGTIPEWDSVNHLRLVMEVERRFGVSYALERIPSMLTLRDFLA